MSEDQNETTNSDAPREAREQAKEYESAFAPTTLRLDDGSEIEVPPHPSLRMLDDDALAEYEKLELELESYDRHPDVDIPEQKVYDPATKLVTMTLPPRVQPGQLKVPYRKTDPETKAVDILDPPYQVRVAQIALGEDYPLLRAGKVDGKRGSAAAVWRIWNVQGVKLAERQAADSKSAGSAVGSAPVLEADKA